MSISLSQVIEIADVWSSGELDSAIPLTSPEVAGYISYEVLLGSDSICAFQIISKLVP